MGDRFEPADGAGPLDAPTNVIDVAAKAEDGSNHQQIHVDPGAAQYGWNAMQVSEHDILVY